MALARLDVMMDEEDKAKLQWLAEAEGRSVSELVRRLVSGYIGGDARVAGAGGAYDAVADMLVLREAVRAFERAYGLGMVYPFSRYRELARAGGLPEGAELLAFVYDDSRPAAGREGCYPAVADKLVDECHEDVISTWTGALRCAELNLLVHGDRPDDPYSLEVRRKWAPPLADGARGVRARADWPGEAVAGGSAGREGGGDGR